MESALAMRQGGRSWAHRLRSHLYLPPLWGAKFGVWAVPRVSALLFLVHAGGLYEAFRVAWICGLLFFAVRLVQPMVGRRSIDRHSLAVRLPLVLVTLTLLAVGQLEAAVLVMFCGFPLSKMLPSWRLDVSQGIDLALAVAFGFAVGLHSFGYALFFAVVDGVYRLVPKTSVWRELDLVPTRAAFLVKETSQPLKALCHAEKWPEAFEAILDMHSDAPDEAMDELKAKTYLKLGFNKEALELCSRYESSKWRCLKAVGLANLGQTKEALDELGLAKAIDLEGYLGYVLEASGEIDSAIHAYERSRLLYSWLRPASRAGHLLLREGQYDAARAQFGKSFRCETLYLRPDDLRGFAECLDGLGQYEEGERARELMDKAESGWS